MTHRERRKEMENRKQPRNSASTDDLNTSIRRQRLGLGKWLSK